MYINFTQFFLFLQLKCVDLDVNANCDSKAAKFMHNTSRVAADTVNWHFQNKTLKNMNQTKEGVSVMRHILFDLCSSFDEACMCRQDWFSPESVVPARGHSHTGLQWWRRSASSAYCLLTSRATDTSNNQRKNHFSNHEWHLVSKNTHTLS